MTGLLAGVPNWRSSLSYFSSCHLERRERTRARVRSWSRKTLCLPALSELPLRSVYPVPDGHKVPRLHRIARCAGDSVPLGMTELLGMTGLLGDDRVKEGLHQIEKIGFGGCPHVIYRRRLAASGLGLVSSPQASRYFS
jgi:hypothetical protein